MSEMKSLIGKFKCPACGQLSDNPDINRETIDHFGEVITYIEEDFDLHCFYACPKCEEESDEWVRVE